MAASGEDVVGGEIEVHEDIDELLSETVRKYSVLYDKTSLSSSSSSAVPIVVIIINKFTLKYLHISLASP